MKYPRTGAMLFAGLAITASTAAVAGVDIGINLGAPVVVAPAPVYVAPPVYAPPPPPPVYYAPPPVVVAPRPAIIIGWHGDRYWDGRRYWGRDEWYRHHPPGHGHWEHGHDHDHGHGHWEHGH